MSEQLPAHFLELVYDAALKSFWRKKALKRFLRRCHINENFLAQLSDSELKRDWLDRLFPKLEASERGQSVISGMARALVEQKSFPDLETLEDASEKITNAKAAVAKLREYLHQKEVNKESERETTRRREDAAKRREELRRATTDLNKLRERLEMMTSEIGTQAGGYKFQDWFYDVMDFADVDNRRPYSKEGRQIDGSVTIDGTTYLVELKFTAGHASAPDVDSLLSKVTTKSDNTMGIMVSISGYSDVAKVTASFAKSPILLLDHSHLYAVLMGTTEFGDMLRRVRRHSSQTGEAYLHPSKFGGN